MHQVIDLTKKKIRAERKERKGEREERGERRVYLWNAYKKPTRDEAFSLDIAFLYFRNRLNTNIQDQCLR